MESQPNVTMPDARAAVRNVGLLMAQKGSHVLAGMVFAALVPRILGPETFGQYALISSISLWFALLSGMSSVQVMSRFVPEFSVREDREGLERFFGSLLALRVISGSFAAALYVALTVISFPELERMALIIVGLSVFFRTCEKLVFAFFLGLNRAARWGMSETVNRWGGIIMIIPGAYFGGLKGACLALMLSEFSVLLIGLSWARQYLSRSRVSFDRSYLSPYLRFSLSFFAGNILMSLSQSSGEILVRMVSADYVQVGFFGIAYRTYLTAAIAVWHFNIAFGPLFSMLLARGGTEELRAWVHVLLKWMGVGGVVAVFGMALLGNNVIPLALGSDYAPVADNLVILTVALLTYGLGCVARLLAVTFSRPGIALQAAIVNLAGFIGVGVALISIRGSLGGCLAVLSASILYAGFFTLRIRRSLKYSLWPWLQPLLLGTVFLPLLYFRSSWQLNIMLFTIFLAGYVVALLWTRILTRDEIATIRDALSSRLPQRIA